MEKQPLKDYLKQLKPQTLLDKSAPRPWYNTYGDCIEFQTVDEAIVGDRIDDFLTIYRSAETDMAIGFQLKDIMALLEKFGCDGLHLKVEVDNDKLVSLAALLLQAYEELPRTIKRRSGYSEAIRNLTKMESDEVQLTASGRS